MEIVRCRDFRARGLVGPGYCQAQGAFGHRALSGAGVRRTRGFTMSRGFLGEEVARDSPPLTAQTPPLSLHNPPTVTDRG